MDWIKEKLQQRIAANVLRTLVDRSDQTDFASNHYLSDDPNGNRSGSRLLTGNSEFKESIEKYIAEYHGAEHSLIFGSGYMANLGLISTLSERNVVFLYDDRIHASIRDGLRLGYGKAYPFEHNDCNDLALKLKKHGEKEAVSRIFVVTESVFSMDGDTPDILEMIRICDDHNALLIVDEAHAIGVVGSSGAGLISHLCAEKQVFARIVTFGKAFGMHGAAVLGSKALRDLLINFCRPFIYSTAPDDGFYSKIKKAYENRLNDGSTISKLKDNCDYIKSLAYELELDIKGDIGAVFSIVCPGNDRVKKLSGELLEKGFDVRAILSPTVPVGAECLRINMHAFNTKTDIKEILTHIKDYVTR